MYARTAHEYEYINLGVSNNDWAKLRIAARTAVFSHHHRFKFGAVVSKSGRILNTAVNVPITSPLVPPDRTSVHAEVKALHGSPIKIGSTIYVVRLDARGIITIAKPCIHCVVYFKEHDVDRVVFTINPTCAHSYKVANL